MTIATRRKFDVLELGRLRIRAMASQTLFRRNHWIVILVDGDEWCADRVSRDSPADDDEDDDEHKTERIKFVRDGRHGRAA